MKINSEHLYKYINELATNEKVKFNVLYDNQYVTQIYWNGESFEWEQGTFTSEAFFNPLYDFVVIEEEKKIPEKFKVHSFGDKDENGNFVSSPFPTNEEFMNKINDIIGYLTYLKSKRDE